MERWILGILFFTISSFVFAGSCYIIMCIVWRKIDEILDAVKRIREDQNWDYFHRGG